MRGHILEGKVQLTCVVDYQASNKLWKHVSHNFDN